MAGEELVFQCLTPKYWEDFERLFGRNGGCAGCWCMYWRIKRSEFNTLAGEGTRRLMKAYIDNGGVPGLLAFQQGEPVGWCSFGRRSEFQALERSRILKPLDDEPVWSIVCFYIRPGYRKQGIMVKLLHAVIDQVREQGGKIVEGYPVAPGGEKVSPTSAYMGLESAFRQAGFIECARPKEKKLIMRCYL